MRYVMIFSVIIQAFFSVEVCENYEYGECAPEKEVCEYWLSVKEKLTMIYKQDLVYAHNGKLYRYDDENATVAIPIADVVTLDGVPKMVIAINDTIPGPPIVVYKGQKIIVHVKNNLLSDTVTIHWHGLHQKGTPYMDGVGFITQYPILSGETFTYQFEAKPKGTFWYHSHVGAQRTNGVYGALIIKERLRSTHTYPTDVIMTVGDWHHESAEEVYIKMIHGDFVRGKPYKPTHTQEGGKFSGVPWVSGLIDGKGRYLNKETGELIEAPITWYKVRMSKKYRFRVINVGTIYPFRISVDQHEITIIASDGYDLKPKLVESFVIHPGERFDFLLKADRQVDNYWIRANSMEVDVQNHTVEAILHYAGASNVNEPVTLRRTCTEDYPCDVINCPFAYYPKEENTNCILMSEIENFDSRDTPPSYGKDSEEHFFNFAFPGKPGNMPASINGRKFLLPRVTSLMEGSRIEETRCNDNKCGMDKICHCFHELDIPFNKTIQLVWLNMGAGTGWSHPIHLHGHSFYVLKMEYPPQNKTSGKLLSDPGNVLLGINDIDCGDGLNYCNAAKWRDTSWTGDNMPGLNLRNPPRKDTLIIPTGGYAVLRIRSDNPGRWFLHCHIEAHLINGMAMVISEAIDKVPKPHKGFPICRSFCEVSSKYDTSIKESKTQECDTKVGLYILVGLLAGFTALFATMIVALGWRWRATISKDFGCKHYGSCHRN